MMSKIAVPIMVGSLEQALADSARAAEFGADLVEFRIDRFADTPEALLELVENAPLPCIVTCRPNWEGGQFQGNDAQRIALLNALAGASVQPAYIDIELAAYQRSAPLRQAVQHLTRGNGDEATAPGLILSAHDFQQRPPHLFRMLETMANDPHCRVIKVAWLARSLRDNLEAFELIQQQAKPTIALCMGEFGLPSRVLAGKFAALLTFAALDRDSATAPGQPTVAELKGQYRFDQLTANTRVFGVIGYPVGHSMSPPIHNAGFEATQVDAVYLPLAIPPAYEHFKATVATWLDAQGLDFAGASVTIPHKQNLLRFVHEHDGRIEPLAAQIGAANTLTRQSDGTLYASNTDYAAALDAVCAALNIDRANLRDRPVAVIGAGGAARAVVAGFAHHRCPVTIYNRTLENAEALAAQFHSDTAPVAAARLDALPKAKEQIFINCTPIGMSPNIDATPMPDLAAMPLASDTVVFDTIYNPQQTRLLREAAARGCITVPGTEMFVRQAAAQFEQWTDHPAPLEVFRQVLDRELGQST